MVAQASPQISAAQVLNAGRRAEADGRFDYAIQFYRHLADHHPGAPEAAAARDALIRLKRRVVSESGAIAAGAAQPPPLRASGKQLSPSLSRADSSAPRRPLRIAPAGPLQPIPPLDIPEPVSAYFTGRLIAQGLAVLGAVLIFAGLLALGGAILPAGTTARLPSWLLPSHFLAGPITVGTGVVLVLAGELARAIFDIARSSRDLAALERAKAEHENSTMH